jgi:citronellol/citronellal dehydrogenase
LISTSVKRSYDTTLGVTPRTVGDGGVGLHPSNQAASSRIAQRDITGGGFWSYTGEMATTLKGKTLFITGASRGIGLSIGLRAAKDGANVVIAAKTSEPHPKLPGTIHTAAKEIEAAGGKALPIVCDIRFEEQVQSAVEQAVKRFGGIDVLVNNASAISLTGTLETPMKKYDLMNGINARGTYLCSQVCLPHLLKSENPHILNLSPPLSMKAKWFSGHTAYSMAKFGMSMCVLGMAEEFQGQVAVNALWPRTVIATAAVMNLLGGEEAVSQARKPEILADAAYLVLTSPKTFTGNFLIDEDFMRTRGVADFAKYLVTPGVEPLPDFFVD